MPQHIKYLAFIPARAGSKGIANKNSKLLLGKPLIQYTIESAIAARKLSAIHISTNSNEVQKIAKQFSNSTQVFLRPENLAQDDSKMIDVVVRHLIDLKSENITVTNVVLLQPTSPIRTNMLIDNCINQFEKEHATSLFAVAECIQQPYDCITIENEKIKFYSHDSNNQNRQSQKKYFFITGSVYITSAEMILNKKTFADEATKIFMTSKQESIDINDDFDWTIAESVLKNMNI